MCDFENIYYEYDTICNIQPNSSHKFLEDQDKLALEQTLG